MGDASRFANTDGMLPERTRGLHQFIVNRLGAKIAAGELAEGTRITPEDVAAEYDASRPVVREALRVLEAKGMVRPRPRTGTRVLPITQWSLLDQDVIAWRIMGPDRQRQLTELTEFRVAVEIHAVRLCVDHATGAHLRTLRQACDEMALAAKVGDADGFTRADITYHTTVLEASGNAVFAQFAAPFAAFLHARVSLHTLPERVEGKVIEAHRGVVDAIAAGEADQAQAQARMLIGRAREELEEQLRARMT